MSDDNSKITDIREFRERIGFDDEDNEQEGSPVDELIYQYLENFFEELVYEYSDGSQDDEFGRTELCQMMNKWAFVTLKVLGNHLAPNLATDKELENVFVPTIRVVDEMLNSIIAEMSEEDDEAEEDSEENIDLDDKDLTDDQIKDIVEKLIRGVLADNSGDNKQ